MLRSIKQLYGDKLGASDGDIGHVKDFYFDDQSWVVRYLVADTETGCRDDRCSSRPMPLPILIRPEKSCA